MAQDWLIFKLSPDAVPREELSDSAVILLDGKEASAAEKTAKASLKGSKAGISVNESGVRLSGASVPEVSKLAEKLEGQLGAVGIAQISTNEWWDRADFEVTRAPLG